MDASIVLFLLGLMPTSDTNQLRYEWDKLNEKWNIE
jgi:hypothetical protein